MNNALSEFIFQSKYARYNQQLGRKETWEESVTRIHNMHIDYLNSKYPYVFNSSEFRNDFMDSIKAYKNKLFIGSQRALQFGGTPILNKHARLFNCSFTYVDRLEVFKEIEWVLLCGCGAGVSVEHQHINKLPEMLPNLSKDTETYVVEDSIEGWALAIQQIINYYFISGTKYPKFDYSSIRPKGSFISGGFIAPGPNGLKNTINKIQEILESVHRTTRKLSSLNCTDIISHCADSVLSGGVRRSALIVIFDEDDEEMFTCKTGNWFYDNPQRARFNMSAALDRKTTSKKTFERIINATKEFGEPGFYWRSDNGVGPNPCCEIGFKPVINGKTGFQFCNLVTINGANIESEEDFYKACKCASTLATIQASYNEFPFLGKTTEELVKSDPLIGVSIGGVMCNPDILTNPKVLKKGAEIVKQQNAKIADILKINHSSRCTTIKPDGNSSVLLNMTPGCHGEHSRYYIRRVQVNKDEEAGQIYKKYNPKAVTDSVWSVNHTDWCIQFPIVAKPNATMKSELVGINQLEIVKLLYVNWILEGMIDKESPITNNVSNTVQVKDWNEVIDWVWENKDYVAGISFIPLSGDLDFNQPPYTEVLMPDQLLETYGDGIIFASGLIVDAINVFGDLWKACDALYGRGEKLFTTYEDAAEFISDYNIAKQELFLDKPYSEYIKASNEQYTRWINLYIDMGYSEDFAEQLVDNDFPIPVNEVQKYLDTKMFGKIPKLSEKREIIRRLRKFACKYFDCNLDLAVRALKHVQLLHDWYDITTSYVPINWKEVKWKKVLINADETGALACSGGNCEIRRL